MKIKQGGEIIPRNSCCINKERKLELNLFNSNFLKLRFVNLTNQYLVVLILFKL